MRDSSEIEFVQGLAPEWLLPAVEFVTRLGDVSFLVALACLLYWFDDRERGVYAFAVILGGFALLSGLKAVFAFPRPPTELHLIATDSTAFPSGHAMGATVVYGTIAIAFDRMGTRTQRMAAAGLIVAAVSLSRVVLGVHYAVDVVVGVIAGVAYLYVATRIARGEPFRAFGLATGIAIGGLVASVLSGGTPFSTCFGGICLDRDTLFATVAATSALIVWAAIEDRFRIDGWVYSTCFVPLTALVASVAALDPDIGFRAGVIAVGTAAVLLLPFLVRAAKPTEKAELSP